MVCMHACERERGKEEKRKGGIEDKGTRTQVGRLLRPKSDSTVRKDISLPSLVVIKGENCIVLHFLGLARVEHHRREIHPGPPLFALWVGALWRI